MESPKNEGERLPVEGTSDLSAGLGGLIAMKNRVQPLRMKALSQRLEDWESLSESELIAVDRYACACINVAEGVLAMLEVKGICILKLDA